MQVFGNKFNMFEIRGKTFKNQCNNVKIEKKIVFGQKICFLNTLYKYRRSASIWQ